MEERTEGRFKMDNGVNGMDEGGMTGTVERVEWMEGVEEGPLRGWKSGSERDRIDK